MIDTIVRALNKWLETNNHSKSGWFIGRQYEEKTQFNAYKTLIAEIYYHIDSNNHLILKQRLTVTLYCFAQHYILTIRRNRK